MSGCGSTAWRPRTSIPSGTCSGRADQPHRPRGRAGAHRRYIRSHWGIENEVHWERDTTLREDDCKVRAQNRPRNLATLRNLLGGLCHQHGFDGTAATIREAEYDKDLLTAITRLITAP